MLGAGVPPTVTQHGNLRVTKLNVKEGGEHAYAAKFSEDGKYFGVTYGSGVVRLFETETLAPVQRMKALPQHDDVPATSIKWRRQTTEGLYEFASATSGGAVYGWQWDRSADSASTFVERAWKGLEEGNETASIDYSPDGALLASVGSDRKVRIYDCETRKLVDTLEKGVDETGHTRPAHTNRVFCAKFASQTTLLTGGWANPVQVWDMRTKKSERQLGGPNVGSDSIEVMEGTSRVVVSSTRKENQLQVFDYISGTEITTESEKLSKGCGNMHLHGVRYLKDSNSLFCIACKPDVILHMDATTGEVKGMVEELGVPIYSCDTIPIFSTKALFCGGKETIIMVDITE